MPDKDGETRRDKNEKAGVLTPLFCIPDSGKYLWDIYLQIIKQINRISENGAYVLIPPSEWKAWFDLTGTIAYPREYDILTSMDRIYCEEANKELEDIRAKEEAEREKNRSKPKRRK